MYAPPEYNKPEEPGVFKGDDDVVSILHRVGPEDDFQSAALGVFGKLREAQERYPDYERVLYLEIEGHKGAVVGYEQDFFEFQQDFLQGYLGPFFRALDTPLASVFNPNEQRNDVPDILEIGSGGSAAAGPPGHH